MESKNIDYSFISEKFSSYQKNMRYRRFVWPLLDNYVNVSEVIIYNTMLCGFIAIANIVMIMLGKYSNYSYIDSVIFFILGLYIFKGYRIAAFLALALYFSDNLLFFIQDTHLFFKFSAVKMLFLHFLFQGFRASLALNKLKITHFNKNS